MLWGEVANGTGLGGEVQSDLDRGELVPDRVMSGLILQRIDRDDCARGFILEGYPRRLAQAELLDGILAELGRRIERVFLIEVPDDVIVARLAGRLVHPTSNRTYHEVFDPPRVPGIDDATGEPIVKRDDDREQVVRERLRVYHRHVTGLADHYRSRGQLVVVNGNQPIARVAEEIEDAVAARVVA
jgi:adenylate kinase